MKTYALYVKPRDAPKEAKSTKVKEWRLPETVRVRTLTSDYTVPGDFQVSMLAWEYAETRLGDGNRYALICDGEIIATVRALTDDEIAGLERERQRREEFDAIERRLNEPVPESRQEKLL